MRRFTQAKNILFFAVLSFVSFNSIAHDTETDEADLLNKYQQQLHFIQNKGQWDDNDIYRAQTFASTVQIRKDGFLLSVIDQQKLIESYELENEMEEADAKHLPRPNRSVVIPQHAWMVRFLGMNKAAKIESKFQDKTYYNYFIGNDKSKWASSVNSYEEVWYKNVYTNIDARLYAAEDLSLEYDMIVRPGANVADIKLAYEGLHGMYINKEGQLCIKTIFGESVYPKPIAYQLKGGKRVSVKCEYTVAKGEILGFEMGEYDKSAPLVIDPIALKWAVYVAYQSTTGSGHNHGIEVDQDQDLYVVGRLSSTNFPTTAGVFQTTATGTNTHGFVAKMSVPNGVNGAGNFIWATYVSGTTAGDNPYSIKLDAAKNSYITGVTASTNFPTTAGAYDVTHNGGNDGFVTKLNSTGTALLYSTFIGSAGTDESNFLYVTPTNEVWIAGRTTNAAFPITAGAIDATFAGAGEAFLAKFNATGTSLLYSTFYGGAGDDAFVCLRPSGVNELIAIGTTSSDNTGNAIATAGAFQTTRSGTALNGMLMKFNTSTNTRTWGTYINPTAGGDLTLTCGQVDNGGNIYFGGHTPGVVAACITAGVYDASFNGGGRDFYLGKINAAGSSLLAGTYIGGNAAETNLMGLNIDDFGKVYAFGYTNSSSPSLSTTSNPLQAANNGGQDAIFFKISSDYSTMEYLSYWGGSNNETDPIGFDGIKFSECKAYTAMTTQSANAPMTRNGFQINKTSGTIQEPAVTVWSNPPDVDVDTITGNENVCYGTAPLLDINGSASTYITSDISRAGVVTPHPGLGTLTYSWSKSTDSINFTVIPAATGQNLTVAEIGVLTQTTHFKRNIGSDFCKGGVIVTKKVVNIAIPDGTESNGGIVCRGAAINLTATGETGATFNWTGPNSFSATGANQTISNAQLVNQGDYYVTQTVAGCTSPPDTVAVSIINCPPVAINDAYSVNEDQVLSDDVTTNDSDPNGDPLTITLDNGNTATANGTLVLNNDGTFTYTPNPNFNGVVSFTYSACDNGVPLPVLCDTATVTITVNSVNDVPTAEADDTTVPEDGSVTVPVLSNDTFGGDGPSTGTISIVTPPTNGTATVNDGGTPNDPTDDQIDYTPNANYNGADNIIYEICDANGDCDTAIVNITVSPVNDVPTAEADDTTVPEDGSVTVPVLSNDTFGGDGPSTGTISIVTPPTNGTATVNDGGTPNDPTDDQIDYTPNANYNGADNIIYEICDANGDCDTAIVNITVSPVNDVPTAEADDTTVPEDGSVTVPVLSNDTFGGDGPSTGTISIVTPPTNGTATVNDGGTPNDPTDDQIDYTPNPNYNGADNIIYEICDANGDCDTAIVNITVSPVNDVPTAEADDTTVPEDGSVTVPVLSNDTFGGDGPSTGTISIVTPPTNGTATVNDGGTPNDPTDDQIDYTPNPNYNGADNIIYEICDANGDCDTAIVNITVSPVNDVPTAEADDTTVPEDGSVTVPVLSNDTFGGDGPSTGTINIVTPPTNGTATVNDGGTPNDPTDDQIDYTPNANYNGADNIIYEICDANGDCDTAIVNITVSPVNDVPTAEADDTTVPEDGSVTVPVLSNDTFGGDGPSTGTISIVTPPTNGTATVNDGGTPNDPTDDQIDYTPNPNYNGADNIIYEICDANGDCDTAIVNITVSPVNDVPTAEADDTTVPEDGSVTVPVLSNDTFGGDGPSTGTISIVTPPTNGTATVNDGGTPNDPTDDQIDYTPNPNYNGADNIIYEICDANGDCDTAIVNITVSPVNDVPTAEADDTTVPEDGSVTVPVLSNDTFGGDGPSTGTISIVTPPTNGTATVNDGGTPNDPTDDQIDYTPNPNYNGADNIIYEICDANGDCDTAIVNITVSPVNDVPTAEADDTTVPEDGSVTVPVLSNDTFGGDGPSTGTISIVTPPTNGTATVNDGGTPNDPTDDQIDYTPNPNYNGADNIIYEICDANGDCDTAIVNITVSPVNDVPTAEADDTTVPEDGSVTVPVLSNDTFGGDGPSTGTISIVTPPTNGTATVNDGGTPNDPTDDQIDYTPNPNYNGADNIIYEICDANGDCDTAIVNITVSPVNDVPTAEADDTTVPEDGSVTVPVLSNDTFGGDGPSTGTISIVTPPTNGTATVNDGGTPNDPTDDQIDYTPNANYNGADNIIYEICDANGDCDTAIVNITVSPVNDPPVIPDTTVTTPEDTPITVCLPITEIDVNDTHTASIGCGPMNGTITSGPTVENGSVCITYTPNENYNGTDSICVIVCDNGGLCDTGKVVINIPPVNDPPVIPDTTVTTPEDTPITVCLPITEIDVNDTHTASIGCGPMNGTITSGPTVENGSVCITYTPNENYNGTDSICVIVCDNGGLCDTGKVVINIPPVNDPPVIPDTTVTTPEDTPITVCLPITEIDVNDTHTASIGCGPMNGTITSGPTVENGSVCITYTPNENYNGTDSICVIVCDNGGLCDTGKVVINIPPVNDPPVIPDTTVTTPEDTPITVCLPITEIDVNDTHTASIGCGPMNGTITSGPTVENGSVCITYTPNENYNGTDSICVIVCDNGGLCDTGKVVINIPPVNDPPVIPDTTVTTPEDTPITVCLPITEIDVNDTHTASIGCGPMNGTITSGPTVENGSVCITYTPNENFNSSDSICVIVCDNGGLCDTGIIHIIIPPTGDTIRPTIPEHVTDTICDYTKPISNDVVIKTCDGSTTGTTELGGTWTIDPLTTCLIYTAGSTKGEDTLCIVACDTVTGQCNTTTIIITVTGYPPLAIVDSATTDIDVPVTIPVLTNDIAQDEDPLTLCDEVAIVTQPSHGTVVVNGDGTITYTPVNGHTGVDSFQYQICDPEGNDTAWVYITIDGCIYSNAFTPNNDGINDYYVIPCAEGDVSFSVWNRWGFEVYRNEQYLNNWDGTYKGGPLPDGTYYYVLKYTKTSGEEVNKAGFIYLHR